MALIRSVGTMSLLLALAACGKGDKEANLAALDAQLTNNAADPALKGALADPILVDPELVGQSNRNAVRTADRPANGAVPVLRGDAGKAQAQATKLAGGKLLSAPAPSEGDAMASTVTLGAVAREQAAARGGNAPQLSVILSVDMFTLLDEDLLLPFDDFATSEDDKAWLNSFYPAFMENSKTDGKTYGIPFQRSTPVLYWNKEAFKAAGLDPNTPPKTWEEFEELKARYG